MYNGWALALAWPDTYCRQAGAWYDCLTDWLGISQDGYYQVGHAALVLIEAHRPEALYFDFGRYHAPFGQGRVRDKTTDHELALHTCIDFRKDGFMNNLEALLDELQQKDACHGTGCLRAAVTPVNFAAAFRKAKMLQELGCIPYGPFVYRGTNCSRFVNRVVRAGQPSAKVALWLALPPMLTPSPIWNIRAIGPYPCKGGEKIADSNHQMNRGRIFEHIDP